MKCPQCTQLIKWQEQHEYEDFNLEGEGIINVHFCTNIDCNVEEVYIEGEGIINVHFCTNIDCNVEEVYIFQKDDATL